jgi:general L-amino acid transport system substrate-binding protein
MVMRFFTILNTLVAVSLLSAPVLGATKETIIARGWLSCGINQGLPGFSSPDAKGRWSGFDVDFCRAVAAAVLRDPAKVRFRTLSAKERFTALQSGEIDLLSRNTTWTQTRDTALGLNFAGIIYYDGQSFMVRRSIGVKSARELSGAAVCVNAGTTTELNLADYFRTRKMRYTPVVFEKSDEVLAAYVAGRCDVYSTDQSGLYAQRLKLRDPAAHVILPDIISKEPLGPVVRQGDDGWFNIVRWTLFALIGAEELGVTSGNVGRLAVSATDPEIRRLLGTEGKVGANLGLDPKWAQRIIAAVGNYGELFERHLGESSRLKIKRGLNRLWNKGGLQYAPPIR